MLISALQTCESGLPWTECRRWAVPYICCLIQARLQELDIFQELLNFFLQ